MITYFGEWPAWFKIYLEGIKYNASIDWMIYTDCKLPDNSPGNIKIIKGDLKSFNLLASKKLNLDVNVQHYYKLCDFKPLYGKIFEDYLKDYDFWGMADIDLIYGNIKKFITDEILENYDIITTHKQYIMGHFTLFRNDRFINELYKKTSYKEIFTQEKLYYFDESNFIYNRPIDSPIPFKEKFSKYLRTFINLYILKNKQIFIPVRAKSITHIVFDLLKKNKIKAYFKFLHETDIKKVYMDIFGWIHTKINKKWKYTWKNGTLFNSITNKEILYFHFQHVKSKQTFTIPDWQKVPGLFHIKPAGFSK